MAKSQETYKEPHENCFSLFAVLETVSRRDGTLSLLVFSGSHYGSPLAWGVTINITQE